MAVSSSFFNTSMLGTLGILVILSGAAGVTWELIWQHHTTLAFGASLLGTALTLACMMGGFGLGSAWILYWARNEKPFNPLKVYAVCEIFIGGAGLLVPYELDLFSRVDSILYMAHPGLGPLPLLVGTTIALLTPSIAMGMTLPALAKLVRAAPHALGKLYAANTAGAVLGILACVFLLLPWLGVHKTSLGIAGVNFATGTAAWVIARQGDPAIRHQLNNEFTSVPRRYLAVAFLTGCVTLMLEVSWFRSLRAAFYATTETFAVILAAFLMALAIGAVLSYRVVSRTQASVHHLLALAGASVLCATPFVDGLDQWSTMSAPSLWGFHLRRYAQTLGVVGLPVCLIGMVFPDLLRRYPSSRNAGHLFAINTWGAVIGALLAGWVLLPRLGSTHTSWLGGALLSIAGVLMASMKERRIFIALAVAGFLAAWHWDQGSARKRVHGFASADFGKVIFVAEEPEATIWVTTENRSRKRKLVIDGFEASGEGVVSEHYMRWMGHLPALAARGKKRGLVICFGTGQTANAARMHGVERLDIADISRAVFRTAPLFSTNEGVLDDPRVFPHVMDGRALLRRSPSATYDFVTLEPMPPNFAGTNNLYSLEFYELVRSKLKRGGVVAQWVPFHLMSPAHTRSVVETFRRIFPFTKLWIDPIGGTGILLGAAAPWTIHSPSKSLDLTLDEVDKGFALDVRGVACLGKGARVVTDDNQLLAYGPERFERVLLGRQGYLKQLRQAVGLVRSCAKTFP